MKQGRKSKTVLALGCALASLVGLVALAPSALAQAPAESEYDLGPLPGAGGESPAQPSAAGPAEAGAESEEGGGTPVPLILLIVIAAICTGLAIWRLRDGGADDDPHHGVGPPTGERQSV